MWNVRTMMQDGKLENIQREMERMKVNMLGLFETRWKVTGGEHLKMSSIQEKQSKRGGAGIILEETTGKLI